MACLESDSGLFQEEYCWSVRESYCFHSPRPISCCPWHWCLRSQIQYSVSWSWHDNLLPIFWQGKETDIFASLDWEVVIWSWAEWSAYVSGHSCKLIIWNIYIMICIKWTQHRYIRKGGPDMIIHKWTPYICSHCPGYWKRGSTTYNIVLIFCSLLLMGSFLWSVNWPLIDVITFFSFLITEAAWMINQNR